jgi:hypothetical protein
MLHTEFTDELHKVLLEKCSNIDFEKLEGFTKHEESIHKLRDRIAASLPTSERGLVNQLADKHVEQLVGVSEEFFLSGFVQGLKVK